MKYAVLLLSVRFMLGMAACTTPVPPPPGVPTVTLTWSESDPAPSYVVFRAPCSVFVPNSGSLTAGTCPTVQASTFVDLVTTPQLTYIDGTVAAGQAYAYGVVANYGNGVTFTSNIVAAKVPATGQIRVALNFDP